jgi:hypothetical protein
MNNPIGSNISQVLFNQNEKTIIPSDSVSAAYQNLSALSGINSMPQEINDMDKQMPAFLQQAHLSTYYQDNPWDILKASNKYGVPTMGGELIPDQPPGYKPGNTLKNTMTKSKSQSNPQNMQRHGREHFSNEESFDGESFDGESFDKRQVRWQ